MEAGTRIVTPAASESPAPDAPPPGSGSSYPTLRQRQMLWTALTAIAVLSLVGIAGIVFFGFITFLSWSYPILLPIGLAVIIALVLEPVVAFLQRKRGLKRETAALFACLLAVVLFCLFWAFILPGIVSEAGGFFKSLPDIVTNGVNKLETSLTAPSEKSPLELRPTEPAPLAPDMTTNELSLVAPPPPAPKMTLSVPPHTEDERAYMHSVMQDWLKKNLPAIEESIQKSVANVIYSAVGPVGQAFGFLLGFGFVPIYVYYFLADQDQISHWHELVPLRRSALRDEVVSVLAEINTSLVSYFRGQIIVAGCNGVLTCIGLTVIGIPYSLVLGIITGALSIVPFLGIIASIIPALLLGFLSAKDDSTLQWLRPVLVLVVFTVVQMTESMFITPRVQSHSTGLHPLVIIIGILFWSMLLPGLLGPIVAVPLTCAVVVLLRRYVWMEKAA
jgi:predicted PurR-regulated permease PerM